jgi:hypothetical protein
MLMSETEFPLSGGRTTIGVVQVGNTVRRPRASNSDFVRSVLLHLESVGFDGSPRHLGADDTGRDVFSFLPGDVPVDLGDFDDATLEAAARLIRRYHDATTSFAQKGDADIVCHNDLSPCNTVFRHGRPTAFIDFDTSSPGKRAHDLGYAAWLWLNIGNEEWSAVEQKRRLKMFLGAYGPKPDEADVVNSMLERQSILIADGARAGNLGMRDWAKECQRWTLEHFPAMPPSP